MKKWSVIKTWKKENGWMIEPVSRDMYCKIGDRAKIGNRADIGDGAEIGNRAKIGNRADIGDGAKIGNGAKIGDGAEIGNRAKIGDRAKIGNGAKIGDGAEIGNRAKIGDRAEIGNRAKIGDGAEIPIYCGGRFSMHWHSVGHIRSGCIIKPFGWWTENILRCAEEHGYTPAQQKLYQVFVKQIIEWQEAMGDLLGTVKK